MNEVRTLERGSLVAARYRLDEVLGRGGHAVVWGATHLVTGKRVALKIIDKPGPRGLIEARAASHLDHPNVIRIHDVFEEGERLVIVMDWLAGESLAARIERSGAQPIGWVVDHFLPMLDAIRTAHRAGIVHRDFKPSNIFVVASEAGEEHLVLLDFGIAKVLDGLLGETAHTESGAILGTPQYMAPEQLFGESTADARADLWSLGIVLSEVLSGTRPTDAPNVGGVLKRITTKEIVPLRKLAPSLPPLLLKHVDALLSFDASERPPSVDRTIEVLREVRPGRATPTTPPAGWRRRLLPSVFLAGALMASAALVRFRSGRESPAGGTSSSVETASTPSPAVLVDEPDGFASAPTSASRRAEQRDAMSDAMSVPMASPASIRSVETPRESPRPHGSTNSSSRRPGIIEKNPYEE